jgi:hypothetical protein
MTVMHSVVVVLAIFAEKRSVEEGTFLRLATLWDQSTCVETG